MSNVEIQQDGLMLGANDTPAYANTLNFRSPILANVNQGVATIQANTSKITDLPSISDAKGSDVLLIVTNATSIPVTERISVSDFFGNIQAETEFYQNTTFVSNVYVINSSVIQIGNSTLNAVAAPTYLSISGVSGVANVEAGLFVVGNTKVNSTVVTVGSNVYINSTALNIGNSSINVVSNSSTISVSNSSTTLKATPGTLTVGNGSVNVISNGVGITFLAPSVTTTISAPNTEQYSNGTYFLNANGSWAIVTGASAIAGGSNTNVQLNSDGNIIGSNAFTFNFAANTLQLSNTSKAVIGNSTVNVAINTSSVSIGANLLVNSSAFYVGNSTSNTKITNVLFTIQNSTGTANVGPGTIAVGPTTLNSSGIYVGANVTASVNNIIIQGSATQGNAIVNAESIYVGNSVNNIQITKNVIDIDTGGANLTINSSSISLANSTVNVSITLPTSVQYSGTNVFLAANGQWATVAPVASINGASQQIQFNASGALAGSNGLLFNSTTNTVSIGNADFVASVNSTSLRLGNSSLYTSVNTSAVKIANSSANITIVAANTTQANGKFFLNGNGQWVDINTTGLINPSNSIPLGSNTHIQFNDSGNMGGSAGFTFNKTTNNVIVANTLTAANLYVTTGAILVGNSTVNVAANATTIRLANSTSNTRISIPTAAQYANTTTFLHANGSWVDMSSVITVPAGPTTALQYNLAGTLVGNGQISISGNSAIVLANSTSNTRISIPTAAQRADRHSVLHANGEWAHVRQILKIRYDGWFFGRSPQFFYNKNWTFIPNTTFSASAGNWTTVAQGTIRVDGDTDGSPGSTVATVVEASAHMYGAFYRTSQNQWPGWYPIWGSHHLFFDNYWWWWNDFDSEIEFRILLNSSITSDVLTRVTTPYRKHISTGTLSYTFTELGEGFYDAKLQARLVNPDSDPAVSIRGRRIKATQ